MRPSQPMTGDAGLGPDPGRCSRLNAILFGHRLRTAFTQSPPQFVVQLLLPCSKELRTYCAEREELLDQVVRPTRPMHQI